MTKIKKFHCFINTINYLYNGEYNSMMKKKP